MSYDAYRTFQKRLRRLSHLYDFTMHSYLRVRSDLREQLQSGAISLRSRIQSEYGFVKGHAVQSVLTHTVDLYPLELRSVLLVRLISEFEVFLASSVREVATRSIEPFKRQTPVPIPRAQLLSFYSVQEIERTLLDQDLRGLSSGGFEEFLKYYTTHLQIDICGNQVPLKQIREIHARRHLHVHRGGRTDAKYCHDYTPKLPVDSPLPIDEAYLKEVLRVLESISTHVMQEIEHRYPRPQPTLLQGTKAYCERGDYAYLLRAVFPDTTAMAAHLDLSRRTGAGPESTLGNLLIFAKVQDLMAEWVVAGPKSTVGPYVAEVAKLANAEYFADFHLTRVVQGEH